MQDTIIINYRDDAVASFQNYKKLAERAIQQVSEEEFFYQIDPESNSIAILIKHIAGNLNSRWRDLLTSDGEKADRNRDTEFEMLGDTKESLMQFWEKGWQTLFDSISELTVDDFSLTVMIRGRSHSIAEAINRQLTHYAYHVGQIVMLAKHFRSDKWNNLSVPKERSSDFNTFMQNEGGVKGGAAQTHLSAEKFRNEKRDA